MPDRNPNGRSHARSAPGQPVTLATKALTAPSLTALQRLAGNAAVGQLLESTGGQLVAGARLVHGLSLQRYKSFEHVEAGATESFIAKDESPYSVKKGDTAAGIARAHAVTVEALVARNKAKVRVWAGAGGHDVEGFDAGDTIAIPSDKLVLASPSKAGPFSNKQQDVTVHGVTMEYGEAMAMADYYQSFDAFEKADPAEINALRVLIRKEGKTTPVGEGEWDKATGGRYMDLNRTNIGHFAPPDPGLIPGKATVTGVNHKTEWEKYHKQAVEMAQKGNRDEALAINAFGDHFLTDAFAAGHLFNKEDLMAKVSASLKDQKAVESFAKKIADVVFADPKSVTLCSKYDTKKTRFRWAIKSADRFATLLEGVNEAMPDLLPNAVAAAVHDQLNSAGVTVTNAHKDAWKVQGDGSLEATGLYIMREAVGQSQINVLNTVRAKAVDMTALYKAVWDFTPSPDAGGKKAIAQAITELADPSTTTTVNAVSDEVKANLKLIMDKIVDHGDLYPPP